MNFAATATVRCTSEGYDARRCRNYCNQPQQRFRDQVVIQYLRPDCSRTDGASDEPSRASTHCSRHADWLLTLGPGFDY